MYVDAAAIIAHDPKQSESPSPVPSPTSLVVKKGSNMRSSTFGPMPVPVSLTVSRTYSPGARRPFKSTLGESNVTPSSLALSVPPLAVAYRAFKHRFITT
jgi:hypothetical protein